MLYSAVLLTNKYTPTKVLSKANFLLNQRYWDFIISSKILYNQNWYY